MFCEYVLRISQLKGEVGLSPLQPRVLNVRDYHMIDWAHEQVCFIVIATSGDGGYYYYIFILCLVTAVKIIMYFIKS